VSLARKLRSEGFSSCRFDFSGIGESEGCFDSDCVLQLWHQIQHGYFVEQFSTVLNQFTTGSKYDDVVLMGLCGGAISSLLTAIEHASVKSIILIGLPIEVEGAPSLATKGTSAIPGISSRLLSRKEWRKLFSAITELSVLKESITSLVNKNGQDRNTGVPANANSTYAVLLRESIEKYIRSGRKILLVYGETDTYYKQFECEIEPWLKSKSYFDKIDLVVIRNGNHSLALPECQDRFYKHLLQFLKS